MAMTTTTIEAKMKAMAGVRAAARQRRKLTRCRRLRSIETMQRRNSRIGGKGQSDRLRNIVADDAMVHEQS